MKEESKLPEGLEEAANKFAVFYDQGTCDGVAQDCFIAGAEWQKAKMLEEAVETQILTTSFINLPKEYLHQNGIQAGDKVRVIVIKKDEK